jgi:site-specific DNA recombinase
MTVPEQLTNKATEMAQAVIYLRVSTKEQAEKGGEAEGYSIPAQREACKRKAASLGAVVVEEFVDRGESAKSADRPELQRMLAYVRENQVGLAIVHKVDRLARSRADDVAINLALKAAGTTLVSCSENIDETPSGMLLHGIMSSIAEFYSRNLANEVMKGLVQKAQSGGTPGKAPIGYLNVRKFENGCELRTVEVDPVRGPLITWAFEVYATGEWTQLALLDALARRGLDVPATRSKPAKPLTLSSLQYMLTNPYYTGTVSFQGVDYEGRHEPLVGPETWRRAQEVLAARSEIREKQRAHPHFLKGIYCGSCGSRMIVTHAKSRSGRIYPYFVCIGRHQKRTNCTMKAVRIETVEELVEDHYGTIQLPAELGEIIERKLRGDLQAHYADARAQRTRHERQRARLLKERDKLLQAHYAEAVPLDLLRSEQKRITAQLAQIDQDLTSSDDHQALIEDNLRKALDLASDCQAAYRDAPPAVKKLFNQTFFKKIYIDDESCLHIELAAPFDILLSDHVRINAQTIALGQPNPQAVEHSLNDNTLEMASILEGVERTWGTGKVPGLKEQVLVGAAGIEPATPRV